MSFLRNLFLRNTDNDVVNPATEESNLYLRHLIKILESNAIVDSNQRQRVIVDNIASNATAVTISSGTVTNVAGIATLNPIWMMMDMMNTSYNTGVRANLTWTAS